MCGKGITTSRRFGVELEGYVDNSDLIGEQTVNETDWDIDTDGSLRNSGCEDCDGDGYYTCPDCNGDGHLECAECSGTGREECAECGGDGNVHIGEYDEDGDPVYEECGMCDGSRYIPCGSCDEEGNELCERCHGESTIICDCRCGEGYHGIEAKSPPIQDTSPIHEMYEWLKGYGWMVDTTAGLHVHVEVNDYKIQDFQKLLALMVGLEPYVFAVNDEFRYGGCLYAKSFFHYQHRILEILGDMRLSEDKQELRGSDDTEKVQFSRDRYMGTNFRSYHGGRRTVEFRYFSPQDSAEMVEAYVELMTKAVEFAKHATYDQILVISRKLLDYNNRFEVGNIVKEIFQLEKADLLNSLFNERTWSTCFHSFPAERLTNIHHTVMQAHVV